MTVSSLSSLAGPFLADGVNRNWAFAFKALAAEDLVLLVDNGAGVITEVGSGSFSVTGLGNDAGGVVTYPIAPAAALAAPYRVTITRRIAYTQSTKVGNQGAYYPKVHETAWDRIVMMVQQVLSFSRASMRAPEADGDINLVLPAKAARASKVLGFDASGLPAIVGTSADLQNVSGAVTAAQGAATAAAGSAGAAAGSATTAGTAAQAATDAAASVNPTNFYTKTAADARYTRYDAAQGLTTPQKVQARSNIDAAPASGAVLQTVSVFSAAGGSTTSTTPVDVSGASVSITPKFANSKILVIASAGGTVAAGGSGVNSVYLASLVRDATTLQTRSVGVVSGAGTNSQTQGGVAFSHLDSPGVTTAVTYKIQHRTSVSTASASSTDVAIVVQEIAA